MPQNRPSQGTSTTTMATMTTTSALALNLLKTLQERIKEQQESSSSSKSKSDENEKQKQKEQTKSSLFALLATISSATKTDLSPETRQQIDTELMACPNLALLKWPLVRALEYPTSSSSSHYRAFLGLPKTMEQTRRFLTQISVDKLREILGTATKHNLDDDLTSTSPTTTVQDLKWVEEVLQYMTGDGKRKKELGGFVLLDKSVVKGAMNRVSRLRKDLEQKQKQQHQAKEQSSSQTTTTKPRQVVQELERDVRVLDKEREQARGNAIGTLFDEALLKRK
jgi:hypothetical protein